MGRVRGGGGVRRGRGGGDGLGVCGEGSGGGCFFFFFFPCSGRPGRHDEASGRRSRGEPGSPPTPPPQPRRAGVLSPPRRPARGHARQTTLGARPPCAAADQRGGSQVADHPAPPPPPSMLGATHPPHSGCHLGLLRPMEAVPLSRPSPLDLHRAAAAGRLLPPAPSAAAGLAAAPLGAAARPLPGRRCAAGAGGCWAPRHPPERAAGLSRVRGGAPPP